MKKVFFIAPVMPEGPSIVILKEELSGFIGKKVLEVSGNAKIDLLRMKGKKISDIQSWGKHCLISFDGFFIRIHLLMFGSYRINERKDAPPRLQLLFRNGEINFYTCSVRIVEGRTEDLYDWRTDTMSDKWSPVKAYRAVIEQKNEMICDSLLDQEIFAGVGNIIKNEVLYLAKVHPETRVKNIPEKKLKEIIKITRAYCFDFLFWKKRFELKKNFKMHTKKTCPDCNGSTTLKWTGKRDRRSFFCNKCQVKYKVKPI
ncbi:MAG TPA: DNA-formamidopyrimidine glycosylase family protein [Bacteroidia bacterium]|jgi:endonuclease-8